MISLHRIATFASRRLPATLPAFLLVLTWAALPQPGRAQSTTITAQSTLPVPFYGVSSFQVKYLNPFRYDYNPTGSSTVINAPTVPSQLLPNSSGSTPNPITSGTAAGNTAQQQLTAMDARIQNLEIGHKLVAAPKKTPAAPAPPSAADCKVDSPTSIWATSADNQANRITLCWNLIRDRVEKTAQDSLTLRQSVNAAIREAGQEQACYAEKVKHFSQTLLTFDRATELRQFVQDEINATPTSCRSQGATSWNLTLADQVDKDVTGEQTDLQNLATALGYSDWLGAKGSPVDTANTALSTQITGIQTDARSYDLGTAGQGTNPTITQTATAFQAVVTANQQWRDRITGIGSAGIDDPNSPYIQSFTPIGCHDWYGKGHTETETLKIVDVSVASSSVPDLQVATNTCNPRSILSTGVGVSFLPNETYAFVPNSAGTQVIGKSASSKVSPLFTILYNILLTPIGKKDSGVELFLTPGIGLTSASSTTTSDYLGGLSVAFNRRLVFLTAAADFGQRTTLLPGFPLGTPMGAMTTVPTQTTMKFRGMLSISFGVAP